MMKRKFEKTIYVLIILVLIFVWSPFAFAVVKNVSLIDSKGAPVSNATVTIVFPDGTEVEKETDDKGVLIFDFTSSGDYVIKDSSGATITTVSISVPAGAPTEAPGQNPWRVTVSATGAQQEVTPVGGGAGVKTSTTEELVNESPDEVNMVGGGLEVSRKIGDKLEVSLAAGASSGDDSEGATVKAGVRKAAGPDDRLFFVYPGLIDGFTGWLLPSGFGVVSKINTDLERREVVAGASFYPIGSPEGKDTKLKTGLKIGYKKDEMEINIDEKLITRPDLGADHRIRVEDDLWTIGLLVEVIHPLGNRFNVFIGGGVDLLYHNTDLDSRYSINNGTRIRNLNSSDDDSRWSFGYHANTGFSILITKRLAIRGEGEYRVENTPAVRVPTSGDAVLAGDTIRLGNEDTSALIGRVKIEFVF